MNANVAGLNYQNESFVLIRFSSNRESEEKDDLIKSTTN